MDTVSLSEFKRNFGEYIASARFGHTVIAFEKVVRKAKEMGVIDDEHEKLVLEWLQTPWNLRL